MPPEHNWRRTVAEFFVLGLLGFGDLLFTSTAFEVFGLSDQHLGFLPFNELELAASSTVVAMLLCTRLAGHKIREVGLLVEQTYSGGLLTEIDEGRTRRLQVRTWFAVGTTIVAILGAVVILVGLSEVRASYLLQSGIDAHFWQFMFVQAGIAAAGFALSAWMAHPYDREHRSTKHHREHRAGGNEHGLRRNFRSWSGASMGCFGSAKRSWRSIVTGRSPRKRTPPAKSSSTHAGHNSPSSSRRSKRSSRATYLGPSTRH